MPGLERLVANLMQSRTVQRVRIRHMAENTIKRDGAAEFEWAAKP